MPRRQAKQPKSVESLTHEEARRRNLPSAEHQPLMRKEEQSPVCVAYERRNRDLDPQLVWRGKDEQDSSDLVVNAPPLYIQERVQPKALIDELMRQSRNGHKPDEFQTDMFADFNGLPSEDAKTEFYRHDANWSNRMVLGDSLQVMASLAEREGLRGKVQCIYIDPPYGIKFNSNFQWSTTSRDVRDGNAAHITREPEQVKAFRDTWRDGIHSYLTYLRDRLTVARDLLAESGSIFVQIGDENVHRVRALMDEVFGEDNFVSLLTIQKTSSQTDRNLSSVSDYLLWFAKNEASLKFRRPFLEKGAGFTAGGQYSRLQLNDFSRIAMTTEQRSNRSALPSGAKIYRHDTLTSQSGGQTTGFEFFDQGRTFHPGRGFWKTNFTGLTRLSRSKRLGHARNSLSYIRFIDDFSVTPVGNLWTDTLTGSFTEDKIYVVQTAQKILQRCILMTTDPGDLVLDPTCGSGTTAYVAEQWGRRWITIDTSRVALALARARVMGARYPYYLLADSPEGQIKEAELAGTVDHEAIEAFERSQSGEPVSTEEAESIVSRGLPLERPTYRDIRQGFVYERVPHVTLRAIANNTEIDVIWEDAQRELEPLREELNRALGESWEEWEIPCDAEETWPNEAKDIHTQWWERRIARQKEIDASIAANADYEYLYDKPYEDRAKVRVAGPFTAESISPHRVLGVDENGDVIAESSNGYGSEYDFAQVMLDNLGTSGVQQAHREDRIEFSSIAPWPGRLVCAEGRYQQGDEEDGIERRAGIFIGPEFGTVSRPDLVEAAREAADANFDVLIACAFNYEAHTTEFESLGRVPVLKARMNADLHMADDLKNTGKGNLFVIFGEPDIDILEAGDDQIQVKVNGVDVFHPNTGEVRSDGPEGIACWFIDTDYNEEAFFVRHAYFLGASDPYKSLKTTLKAEIDADAWATLHSDTSRPFSKPESGRIAVKVINHLGDEVLKVFRVG